MRFWDASAIVPLMVPERGGDRILALYREDPALWVWALTPVEIVSALSRKRRQGFDVPDLA